MSSPPPPPGHYGHQSQQGGYHQNYPQGPYHGGPPQRPRGKKGGIIASVAIVVLLLSALAVTAFITPGFLVEKEYNAGTIPMATLPPPREITPPPGLTRKPSNSNESSGSTGGGGVLQEFITHLNEGNAQKASALVCPEARQNLEKSIADIAGKSAQLTIGNIREGSNGTIGGDVAGTIDGAPINQPAINATQSGSGFCIAAFTVAY